MSDSPEPIKTDNAAQVLADQLALHPLGVVLEAFRILGIKASFTSVEGNDDRCPECGGTGACNGGPCALVKPQEPPASLSRCGTCQGVIGYINAPTGGWWAHERHPHDGHDAVPTFESCRAVHVVLHEGPEVCVVHGDHERHEGVVLHRAASGAAWTDLGVEPELD